MPTTPPSSLTRRGLLRAGAAAPLTSVLPPRAGRAAALIPVVAAFGCQRSRELTPVCSFERTRQMRMSL